MLVAILFAVNFAISWFNAWSCGSTWDSTRAKGGLAHFMNWMGATMSASGFTWCYLVVLGFLGSHTPMAWFVEAEPGAEAVAGMLLDPAAVQAFYDLGYLAIILPHPGVRLGHHGLNVAVRCSEEAQDRWRLRHRGLEHGRAGPQHLLCAPEHPEGSGRAGWVLRRVWGW